VILSNFAFQNNNSFLLRRKNYSHCAFATTGSSSNTNQDTFPNQELYLDYVLQNNIIVPVNQTINLIGTKYLTVQEGVVWCVNIIFFGKDFVSSIFFIDLSSRLVIYKKTLYQPFNVSDCIVAIQEACLVTNKQPKVVMLISNLTMNIGNLPFFIWESVVLFPNLLLTGIKSLNV
jgi:hypothetical protein